MIIRMFFSSLFNLRNLSVLLISVGAAYLAATLSPENTAVVYSFGLGAYLLSVIQSLASRKFHEKFKHKEKIRHIQNLNYTCLKLASEAKRHVNAIQSQKMRRVIDDKNDIVNSFFRGEQGYLKEKIVEQTLSLVIYYIKLLTNYSIRGKELYAMDIGEITNRININMRKLNFIKDPKTEDDVKRVIEMDEKIINRLKEERKELDRISAKLDYMESTVNMFKHQVLSSIESEEMLEKLETVVNEATALDNALEDRRKSRISL